MGSISEVPNPDILGGGETFGAAIARGARYESGYITFASAYVSGGLTWTAPFASKLDFIGFENPIPGSYRCHYDRSNTKVIVEDVASATAPYAELASDTSVASLTSVHFVAFGRR